MVYHCLNYSHVVVELSWPLPNQCGKTLQETRIQFYFICIAILKIDSVPKQLYRNVAIDLMIRNEVNQTEKGTYPLLGDIRQQDYKSLLSYNCIL